MARVQAERRAAERGIGAEDQPTGAQRLASKRETLGADHVTGRDG